MKWEKRVTQITLLPEGAPLFDVLATVIQIDDEVAGEFVTVKNVDREQGIAIDVNEWPILRSAIDEMIGNCKTKGE